ncbi:MAG: GNAT family N-acetyltransferase [Gaiellaceae bacterium]
MTADGHKDEGPGLEIRPLEDGDLPGVLELVQATIDACYPGVYPPRAVEFFRRYHGETSIREDAQAGHTVVAIADARMVGTGTLLGEGIRRVFLRPDRQGRGLGREIMRVLEERARADGAEALELDASLVAERFYLGLGYEVVAGKSIDVGGGERLRYLEMTKRLAPRPTSASA